MKCGYENFPSNISHFDFWIDRGNFRVTIVFSLIGVSLMLITQVRNFPLAYHVLKTVKILDCLVITLTKTQVKNFMTTWRPFVTIWIPLSRYLISVPGLQFASRPSSIRDISGCNSPMEQN